MVTSLIFATMTVLTSLLQISEWQQACGVAGGLIIFIITMSLTLKARFKNKVRIVVLTSGVTLSVTVSMLFAKRYN